MSTYNQILATQFEDIIDASAPSSQPHQPSQNPKEVKLQEVQNLFYKALCLGDMPKNVKRHMQKLTSQICAYGSFETLQKEFIDRVVSSTRVQHLAPIITLDTAEMVFCQEHGKKNKVLLQNFLRHEMNFSHAKVADTSPSAFFAILQFFVDMGEHSEVSHLLDIVVEKNLSARLQEMIQTHALDFSGYFALGEKLHPSKNICEIKLTEDAPLFIHRAFLEDIDERQIDGSETMGTILEAQMTAIDGLIPAYEKKKEAVKNLKRFMRAARPLDSKPILTRIWNVFAPSTNHLNRKEGKKGHKLRFKLAQKLDMPFVHEKFISLLVQGLTKHDPKAKKFAQKHFGDGYQLAVFKYLVEKGKPLELPINTLLRFLDTMGVETITIGDAKLLHTLYLEIQKAFPDALGLDEQLQRAVRALAREA